jgi:gliding motility-associated-like protein
MNKAILILLLLIGINKITNAQCAFGESIILNPDPSTIPNCTYDIGQTVNVCYTIGGYVQTGSNWIHGMVLDLGSGWDASTITITQYPNSCSGNGNWGYYNSVTSQNTNITYGPGFYYDYNTLFNPGDSNPGNNWGDFNSLGTCTWTICFDITVGSVGGLPLDLSIVATGDATTGSWTNPANCQGTYFNAYPATIPNPISCACPIPIVGLTVIAIDQPCQLGNGYINITPEGGVSPFDYIWQDGQTTSTITDLSGGNYCVTVTDVNGCSTSECITLSDNTNQMQMSFVTDSVDCFGGVNGSIQAIPILGDTPYTYIWSNGLTNQIINNISAGIYNVTITDSSGCIITADTTLYQPLEIETDTISTPASCDLSQNGSASVIVSGGVTPYNYLWSNGITDQTIDSISAGAYTVTTTDSKGCSTTDTVLVYLDTPFTVYAGVDKEVLRGTQTDIYAIPNQGGVCSYNWAPIAGVNNPNSSYTVVTPSITTTYVVICLDTQTGCVATDSIIITVLPNEYLFVPNVFSPNNDGYNNTIFPIVGDNISIVDFKIYNRWGLLVYNGSSQPGWDGTYNQVKQDVGVYVYFCRYQLNGHTYTKRGNITLIK